MALETLKPSHNVTKLRARQSTALPPSSFLHLLERTIKKSPNGLCGNEAAAATFTRYPKDSPWQFLSLPSLRYIKLPREVNRAKLVLHAEGSDIMLEIFNADSGALLDKRIYDGPISEFLHPEAAGARALWRWLKYFSEPRPEKIILRTLKDYPVLNLKDWPGETSKVWFPLWAKDKKVEVSGVINDGRRRALFSFPENGSSFEMALRGRKLIRLDTEVALSVRTGQKGFAHHEELPNITFIHGPRIEQPFRVAIDKKTGTISKITYNGHYERKIPFNIAEQRGNVYVILDKKGVSLDQIKQKRLNLVLPDIPLRFSCNRKHGEIPYVVVFDRRFSLEKPEKSDPVLKDRRSFTSDVHILDGHVVRIELKRRGERFRVHEFLAVRDFSGRIIAASREETPSLVDGMGNYFVECRRPFAQSDGSLAFSWLRKKHSLGLFNPGASYLSLVVNKYGAVTRTDIWPEPIRNPYVIEISDGSAPTVFVRSEVSDGFTGERIFSLPRKGAINGIFFWSRKD